MHDLVSVHLLGELVEFVRIALELHHYVGQYRLDASERNKPPPLVASLV